MTGEWCAEYRSAMQTAITASTAIAPRGRAWRRPWRLWTRKLGPGLASVPRIQLGTNVQTSSTGNDDALLIRGPNGNARCGSRICDATLRAAPRPGHELRPIKILAGASRR